MPIRLYIEKIFSDFNIFEQIYTCNLIKYIYNNFPIEIVKEYFIHINEI